jgi:glycosyltransferase involved in cell wall biosynthesis
MDIVIPWRDSGCLYRRKHFEFLYDYYSQKHEVVIGDNEGAFNRSAARNAGVRNAMTDVVVVIDADNYIDHKYIDYAITMANRNDVLVKPFEWFGYLTEASTEAFYFAQASNRTNKSWEFLNPPAKGFTGGGYAIKRDLWLDIGGMDEGFDGWGAEDDAFHIYCDKMLGKTLYGLGYDYHLFHPAYRVTSEYNYNKLMKEYVNGNITPRN